MKLLLHIHLQTLSYESIQDAIALALLVALPGWLFRQISGHDYSGFDICMQNSNWFSVDRYACFVIVTADMAGWILLFSRVIHRFFRALRPSQKRSNNNAKP